MLIEFNKLNYCPWCGRRLVIEEQGVAPFYRRVVRKCRKCQFQRDDKQEGYYFQYPRFDPATGTKEIEELRVKS